MSKEVNDVKPLQMTYSPLRVTEDPRLNAVRAHERPGLGREIKAAIIFHF
jgi:hypothetical protein